jgi:hypothetical protein
MDIPKTCSILEDTTLIRKNLIAAAAAVAFLPSMASAASIWVAPALAPNAFGSPSYAPWVSNATQALHEGLSSKGTPGMPSYYQAQSIVTAAQGIVTGFPSWMGVADPGTAFGSQFANELGNRMLFGLKIDGGGSAFAINDLSFNATSSDPGNALGFGFGAGSYNYSNDYEGVLKGADNILWTADDTFITSGPNTQLVDGLVGRGSGNSFAAYCPGCTIAQQQDAINNAASYWNPYGGGNFTGTYMLGGDSGSGTFTITAVPEPGIWAMMILGLGGVGAVMRRRRDTSASALVA